VVETYGNLLLICKELRQFFPRVAKVGLTRLSKRSVTTKKGATLEIAAPFLI